MQTSLEGPPRTKSDLCLTDNTRRDTGEQNYLPTGRLNQNSGSSSSDLCLHALWVTSPISSSSQNSLFHSGCTDFRVFLGAVIVMLVVKVVAMVVECLWCGHECEYS